MLAAFSVLRIFEAQEEWSLSEKEGQVRWSLRSLKFVGCTVEDHGEWKASASILMADQVKDLNMLGGHDPSTFPTSANSFAHISE